ncbi:hypothetical protein SAMN05660284_00459 [Formivibrio citricus]|uniref:ABC-type amino acid transport substrate-binding protein n=1 Tax=Formivibrio citricus TaxID=83765 RepID=A0A1I4W0G4_9NEIS|nr:hypothetical protein [Formivibrio citricus]SFN06629.1 hypothetical protein SAMN05660284_00459 [Formivibrio citricus]
MRRLLAFVPLLFSTWLHAEDGVLVMAYPAREKEPLIAEAPDNSGLYQDLFSRAAQKIGMQLKIVRLPKRRIFHEMQDGKVDFYPGSFAEDRVAVMSWVENGIMTREVCLTRPEVPPLNGLESAPPLRVIVELGASKSEISRRFPSLKPVELGPMIDIPQAVRFLNGNWGDLFFIERGPFFYYLKKNKQPSAEAIGVRLHENCLGPAYPMHIGFSRHSRHYAEEPNPRYNPNAPLSPHNLPTRILPSSTAGKLAHVLQQMKSSGETRRLIGRYQVSFE